MTEALLKALFPDSHIGEIVYSPKEKYIEFWDKDANVGDGLWIDTTFPELQEMLEAYVFSTGFKISCVQREENLWSADIFHGTRGGTRAIKETKTEASIEACEWLVNFNKGEDE